MALATRCPACSTVFRISTAQAAAKGGMVRCGQCRNVFNSLDALVRVEDLEVIEEVLVDSSSEQSTAIDAPHPAFDEADDVLPYTEAAVAATDVEAPLETDELVAHSLVAADPQVPAKEFAEQAVISEWWLPDPSTEHGPSTSADLATGPLGDARDATTSDSSLRRLDQRREHQVEGGTNPVFMRPEAPVTRGHRATRWVLSGLSFVAALLLLAQVAYLWRDELAARWSPSRPWLSAACAALRCTINHPVHAESVTIESASVQTTGPNSNLYVLTALLRNHDTVDVRYPHLELVLTDLQDQPVLRRELRPEDYLAESRDAGRSAASGFAAESELPLHLTFELNNLRFAGYRLNQFYP
jgi:predicted Zn finger-like uncharacterized protein